MKLRKSGNGWVGLSAEDCGPVGDGWTLSALALRSEQPACGHRPSLREGCYALVPWSWTFGDDPKIVRAWVTDESLHRDLRTASLVPSDGLQKFRLSLPSAPSRSWRFLLNLSHLTLPSPGVTAAACKVNLPWASASSRTWAGGAVVCRRVWLGCPSSGSTAFLICDPWLSLSLSKCPPFFVYKI